MPKQINLTLAAAGDVAVLRNGREKEILRFNNTNRSCLGIRLVFDSFSFKPRYYNINGTFSLSEPTSNDILDILRNGKSIFEQPTE